MTHANAELKRILAGTDVSPVLWTDARMAAAFAAWAHGIGASRGLVGLALEGAAVEALRALWDVHGRGTPITTSVGAYARGVIRSYARQELARRPRGWDEETGEGSRVAEAVSARVEGEEMERALLDILDALPSLQRQSLVLGRMGTPVSVMAELLRRSPDAIHNLLHHARKAVRRHLERRGMI